MATAQTKDAVGLRKLLKQRKPTFRRQNQGIPRVRDGWRKPRGRHSKVRLKLRSYRKQPTIGYSSPRKARHLTREGYEQVIVTSPSQLDKGLKAVIIGGTVGAKKRLAIIKKAQELNIIILNIKDTKAYEERVRGAMKQRKQKKDEKMKKKEKLKKEAEKKSKEQKEKTNEATEEQRKKEAEEKRKVLEKK